MSDETTQHEPEIIMPKKKVEQPQEIQLYKVQATDVMDPTAYQQIKLIAKDFLASDALPTSLKNENQVLVAIQAGMEMGMRPYESVKSLYFVNGQLNIWGSALVRRLREHGWRIKYSNETDDGVTATVSKGDEEYIETYTYQEAEASGYTKDSYGKDKVGWKKGTNRRLKLRYGVLSLIIKTYLPDVLGSASNIVEVEEDYIPEKKTITVAGETLEKPSKEELTSDDQQEKPADLEQIDLDNLLKDVQ